MKNNVGSTDKIIRTIIGIAIILAGIYYGSWLGLLGLIPLFTVATGWCPLYGLLGVSTDKSDRARPQASM